MTKHKIGDKTTVGTIVHIEFVSIKYDLCKIATTQEEVDKLYEEAGCAIGDGTYRYGIKYDDGYIRFLFQHEIEQYIID